MNDKRTSSILRRLPVILAVTAASYGLPLQGSAAQRSGAPGPAGKHASASGQIHPSAPGTMVRR